jgi:FKBP-type peptidyl-prolyl cis-trans isomerase FkpA
MSVSTLAHPPRHGAALTKFWVGTAFVIAVGVGLAWVGTSPARDQLEVQTLEPGSGPFIQPVDGVLIDYELHLPDGKLFDSNNGRGPQPLLAGQTIPGFAQALTQMQKGGRYKVHVPAKLGYGANSPPGMPPNSDLDFDVHVVQVVPNAAAMAAQQQAMQEQGQAGEGQPAEGQPGAGDLPPGQ